jgi:hypothetical protein
MDFNTALSELNTTIGDSNDVTFTSSEKTRALTRSWNDTWVCTEAWDTTLTFTVGTYQYTKPTGVDGIADIYISVTGSNQPMPSPIDSSLWEDVNGNIQFNWRANNLIPTGSVLYIRGRKKLATTDSITDPNMQEYILALAGVNTIRMLSHKKANLFTKNDVTMSELIGLKKDLQSDVVELRRRIRAKWESA